MKAMTNHRPYSPDVEIEAALVKKEKHKGFIYDAIVVDTCLHFVHEKNLFVEVT